VAAAPPARLYVDLLIDEPLEPVYWTEVFPRKRS